MKKVYLFVLMVVCFGYVGISQVVKFDLSTLTGGANNFGASPLSPTTSNANVTIVGLTRGAGIGTTGTAAAKAWGGTGFTTANNTQALALAGNQVASFTITANAGYSVSLSGIPIYNIRRSASGPTTGIWQYQVGAGAFTDIGSAITWGAVTTSAGNDQAPIDLSLIPALQNVAAGTTITLRVILWGSTATTGTWYFNDQTSGTRDLIVNGSVNATAVPAFNINSNFTTFAANAGTPTTQQSYTISGLNLTPNQVNGISITAPANFEVSLTSNTFTGTNANTVTLSSNGAGNIVGEPVTVYVRYFPSAAGTDAATIGHSGAGVSPAQTVAVNGVSTAYYYSKATGLLTDPTTFNSATDGSGTDAVNFTTANQTFEIRNRATATITADWTVSGTSSRIVVGNGVDFTIPSTNLVTGTIDVLGTGNLILQNSTLPALGTLATGSTVEYAQTTATSILNTTTDLVTYSNLRLSNSGLKSFKNSTTTVTGNLIYDGSTNGPLAIEAASAATFTTVNLGGDLTYQGVVTNPVDANSYTLVTTGTGTQTIKGNNNTARFFRITANSSGNNVVLSNTGGTTNTILGNLSGGGLTLNAGTTITINNNTVTFFAGTTTSVAGAGSITGSPSSNIVINKIGTTAFGTMNFTSGSALLNNLTVNITSTTPTVTLGTSLDLSGTLTLTAGKILLGANNLSTPSITGSSSSNYIVTNGTGALTITNVGASLVTFPVGPSVSLYHPATINNAGTVDNFSVKVASAAPPCASASTSVNATWDITEAIAGGSNCAITLDYTGATTGGAYDALQAQIAHCNGATADYHNGSVTGSVASGTGFTGFSPFTVTNDLAVLPVSFTSVKASQQTGGVKVEWSNLTETDIANYAVERSADGTNFISIGTMNARLNNGSKADYSFFDATAADGVNYYRINAKGINGSSKYSIIVKVNTRGGKTDVTIYPNPVSDGKISLQASSLPKGQYTVRIINAAGQSVMSKPLLHTGGAVTTVVELPAAVKAGMYSLQLIGGEVNLTKTFIVR